MLNAQESIIFQGYPEQLGLFEHFIDTEKRDPRCLLKLNFLEGK